MKTILLILFVLFCGGYDLKAFKIPNRFILAGGAAGIGIRLLQDGSSCLADMAAGALIPAAVCAFLFYFSMIGAADIKMLMVIGIFAGKGEIGKIMWYSLLIAAAGALIRILRYRMTFLRGFYLYDYIRRVLEGEKPSAYISRNEINSRSRWLMHLALPIAAGTIVWVVRSLI